MTSLKKPLVYVGIIASDMIGFKNTPTYIVWVRWYRATLLPDRVPIHPTTLSTGQICPIVQQDTEWALAVL
jgi:hypothetical protein